MRVCVCVHAFVFIYYLLHTHAHTHTRAHTHTQYYVFEYPPDHTAVRVKFTSEGETASVCAIASIQQTFVSNRLLSACSVHEVAVPFPSHPSTADGVGRNASCAVGDFARPTC